MTTLYTDNFDSDTPSAIAPGWTAIAGTWLVGASHPVSGARSFGSTTGAQADKAIYTAGSFTQADQTFSLSQVLSADAQIGPMARCDSTGANGYVVLVDGTYGNLNMYKFVAGAPSVIGTQVGVAVVAGHTIALEISCVGTTIEARYWDITAGGTRPSTATASATDASRAVGTAGMFLQASGSASPQAIDDVVWTNATTASAAVTLTSPAAYQVFQRSGVTGSIAIGGQHSDSVARSVEASFNGGAFVTIAANVAPNTPFAGSLPAQTQGAGSVVVRLVGNTAISATVANVGIGDVFLLAGQSNNVGQGTNNQVYQNPNLPSGAFSAAYTWGSTADPIGDTTGQLDSSLPGGSAGGSVWPLVAGRLASFLKVPIGFVQCSRDGCGLSYTTNVQTWLPIPANHVDRTKLYGSAVYRAQTVGGVKAVLYWGGESDAYGGRTQAQYSADLLTIANAFKADLSVPFMPCALERYTAVSDAAQALINNATTALWGTGSIVAGPDLRDLQSGGDGFHLITDAALSVAADRWVAALESAFYGSAPSTQVFRLGSIGLTAAGSILVVL